MTPEQRSRCMSRIRGTDTGPELLLRKALWRKGYRYRLQYSLPGKPDITFVSARLAMFVDGCFWHGCPVHGVMPKGNREFWQRKIGRNQERDRLLTIQLEGMGWRVFRCWEHEVNEAVESVVERIGELIRDGSR